MKTRDICCLASGIEPRSWHRTVPARLDEVFYLQREPNTGLVLRRRVHQYTGHSEEKACYPRIYGADAGEPCTKEDRTDQRGKEASQLPIGNNDVVELGTHRL